MFKSILVIGCGDIGLNIGKILKQTQLSKNTVGCDVGDFHPGKFIFNHTDILPRADAPNFFENLSALIKKHEIDLIVPSSEAVIKVFHQSNYGVSFLGTPVLVANKKTLDVGLDKYTTAKFLEDSKLLSPWTIRVKEGDPMQIPCILKDASGSGSRSVITVDDALLIPHYRKTRPNAIWQELLGTADEEYTCGVYRTKPVQGKSEVRTIVIHRHLFGGLTGYGEVVTHPEIEVLLNQLAEGLELEGSINVQLRLTSKGPYIFEINPRFSSTVMFRHLLGFQDLVWSIQERSGMQLTPYINQSIGKKIYRGAAEYIW